MKAQRRETASDKGQGLSCRKRPVPDEHKTYIENSESLQQEQATAGCWVGKGTIGSAFQKDHFLEQAP